MRRTSSRRSVNLHPRQNGRCTIVIEISKIRMSRYLDTPTKTQMAKIMVQHGRRLGKSSKWGMLIYEPRKGLFLSVYVDDIKLAGKKQNIDPMWKVPVKEVDLGEPTSFKDHVYLGRTQRGCETSKDIVDKYINIKCWNPESLQGQKKNYLFQGNLAQTSSHGPMVWKVMQRNVCNDIASWQTQHPSNCTKSQHHALTTTNSRKKKWDLLESCQRFPHILF